MVGLWEIVKFSITSPSFNLGIINLQKILSGLWVIIHSYLGSVFFIICINDLSLLGLGNVSVNLIETFIFLHLIILKSLCHSKFSLIWIIIILLPSKNTSFPFRFLLRNCHKISLLYMILTIRFIRSLTIKICNGRVILVGISLFKSLRL